MSTMLHFCHCLKASITHARKLGKLHGRPPSAAKQKEQIQKLFAKRLAKAETARQLNIGRASIKQLLMKNKKSMQSKIHYRCPRCGRQLVERIGATGIFWGCSYYPRCKKTLSDHNGKPFFRHLFDNQCPHCQQGYLIKQKKNRNYCWICDESVSCGAAFSGSRKPNKQREMI